MPHAKSFVPLICYCIGVPNTSTSIPLSSHPLPHFTPRWPLKFQRCCCRASNHMRHSTGIPPFWPCPCHTPSCQSNKKLCNFLGPPKTKGWPRPTTTTESKYNIQNKNGNISQKNNAHMCGKTGDKCVGFWKDIIETVAEGPQKHATVYLKCRAPKNVPIWKANFWK